LLASFVFPAGAATDARVSENYGKLPLHFEANRGQTDKDVRFLSRGTGYSLYLTSGEAVLVLTKPNPDAKHDVRGTQARPDPKAPVKSVALRMSLVGAARQPLVSGLDELPGKANYFIGKDAAKWHTNVPTYAKVHYREIYPGIDLVYYGNQRQLEYDFVVAPGADPKKIALRFQGADKLEIDAEGDLVLHTAGGNIRQHKPIVYQEIDGTRQEIAGSYVRKGANRVGFHVATYDRSRPLIIDPLVLSYSTYLGGSFNDSVTSIAVDSAGNAYVTGIAQSTDFPTTPGSFQPTSGGTSTFVTSTFVTKLNPAGSALVYSTYLSNDFFSAGIAIDADGNAYITGSASADFPTTQGAFQPNFGGGTDAFLAKLNPAGSALVYSTYLGGTQFDGGSKIAVDAAGNAYVTGMTRSIDFPTANAFQPSYAGSSSSSDAFVAKVNPTGTVLVYSTYLGGAAFDEGTGIAVDMGGNAYVTGSTSSADFPTTAGAFQPAFGGTRDTFVAKLTPAGSLVYSTYLGGSAGEYGNAVAVDDEGNVYVAGSTQSRNFPTTAGAFQRAFSDGFDPICICVAADAFVTKLDPTGSNLVYSTYLGGNATDRAFGIAVDSARDVYVTGAAASANFPTTVGAFQPSYRGGSFDAFVTKLDRTGSALVYSSYLGGSFQDAGLGIAVDAARNVYVAGGTGFEHPNSNDFPTTPGAFQRTPGGRLTRFNAFVAKFTDLIPSSSTPFNGTPFVIPGTFEAEDFDRGGEGVAYHDNVPGNAGGQYRPGEDVDIIASSDSAGGTYVVNNFETGEWLNYTINVQSAANYDIELRVTSMFADSAFHVEIDQVDVTGRIGVPNTGSWSGFQWVGKKGIPLSAGRHVLKIVSDQQYFDFNSVRVLPSTTRFEENAATYTGAWSTYGPETGNFSGGTLLASNQIAATATFTFTGTAVSWIGVKCNVCGIAMVSVDGGLPTIVNTSGPGAPGSLSSEVVFSASGLAPDAAHTLVITATGVGTALPGLLTGGMYVAVDAFDVTR
jgi:hypothetical protein